MEEENGVVVYETAEDVIVYEPRKTDITEKAIPITGEYYQSEEDGRLLKLLAVGNTRMDGMTKLRCLAIEMPPLEGDTYPASIGIKDVYAMQQSEDLLYVESDDEEDSLYTLAYRAVDADTFDEGWQQVQDVLGFAKEESIYVPVFQ